MFFEPGGFADGGNSTLSTLIPVTDNVGAILDFFWLPSVLRIEAKKKKGNGFVLVFVP